MKKISVVELISNALNIKRKQSYKYLSKFLSVEIKNDIESNKRSYRISVKNKNKFLIQFIAFLNKEKLHYRSFDDKVFLDNVKASNQKPTLNYSTMQLDTVVEILEKNKHVQVEISPSIKTLLRDKTRLQGKTLSILSLETKNEYSTRQVSKSPISKPTIRKNDFNFDSLSKLITNQVEDYQHSIESLQNTSVLDLCEFGLYIQNLMNSFQDRNEVIQKQWLEQNKDLVKSWEKTHKNKDFNEFPKDIFIDFKDVQFAVFTKESTVAVKDGVISVKDIALRFAYSKNEKTILKTEVNIGMLLKVNGLIIELEEITVQY